MESAALTRAFSPGNRKAPGPYQLKKMKSIHKRIAEQVALGNSDREIASSLNVTTQMVAYTRRSAIVQQYLGNLEDDIRDGVIDVAEEIRQLGPYAVRVLETTMLNPGTADKLKAEIARDLLDRAGHSAVKRVESLHAHMTAADIDEIKARARASGIVGSLGNGEASSEAKPSEGEGGGLSVNADAADED